MNSRRMDISMPGFDSITFGLNANVPPNALSRWHTNQHNHHIIGKVKFETE